MITKTPGVCGGRACVGGRRIPVWLLVKCRDLVCVDEEAVALMFDPPLTLAELDEAWAYALDNKEEIVRDIKEDVLE